MDERDHFCEQARALGDGDVLTRKLGKWGIDIYETGHEVNPPRIEGMRFCPYCGAQLATLAATRG